MNLPNWLWSEPVAWAMCVLRCAGLVLAAVVVRNLIWGSRRGA